MGILDKIIERGENKHQNSALSNTNEENNQPQETSASDIKEELSASVKPQEDSVTEEQNNNTNEEKKKFGFWGSLKNSLREKPEELKPLKEYKQSRKLGRASFILSLIASIMLISICGFFALTSILSITGTSTGLNRLFSAEANTMSLGLSGTLGVFTVLLIATVVILIIALLVGVCYFPVYSTIKLKAKMKYPAGLFSLMMLSNVLLIIGNIVYFILTALVGLFVISNGGSPVIYITMFLASVIMLAVAILVIVDSSKSRKQAVALSQEEKEEYSEEYQNIKAHNRRKRR
ncbi:MAG: hypothetical protein IJT25_03230, partial [Clostridia bacterium]|nr:hypothetical protein [Clostridia bacterium]